MTSENSWKSGATYFREQSFPWTAKRMGETNLVAYSTAQHKCKMKCIVLYGVIQISILLYITAAIPKLLEEEA